MADEQELAVLRAHIEGLGQRLAALSPVVPVDGAAVEQEPLATEAAALILATRLGLARRAAARALALAESLATVGPEGLSAPNFGVDYSIQSDDLLSSLPR